MNLKKIILLGGVGAASAVAGVMIPSMMKGQSHDGAEAVKPDAGGHDAGHAKKDTKEAKPKDDHGGSGHGAAGHGADAKGKAEKPLDGPSFVAFGRTVVNLNDPTLTRYLSLEVVMQVKGVDEDDVRSALELRKPILQTWLTTHLADKTLEDLRGKVGVNRLRREIQDNFNALLFTDGRERIQDICYDEFHIQ